MQSLLVCHRPLYQCRGINDLGLGVGFVYLSLKVATHLMEGVDVTAVGFMFVCTDLNVFGVEHPLVKRVRIKTVCCLNQGSGLRKSRLHVFGENVLFLG